MKHNISAITLILILLTSMACQRTALVKQTGAIQRPNFLFILVDDLGYKDLGYAGSKYYESPNIDALSNRSMIFTQAYACSRVCSPSRASIMTGQFTARHGITDWIGAATGEAWRALNRQDKMLPAAYVTALPSSATTLPEAMKDNGYTTFFAGKWHLGGEGSLPEDHGFDFNVGGWDKGSPVGGYFSPFENPKLKDHYDGENLSMRLAKETASFINEHQNATFFAFLSFYAVHGPIQTTQEKWKKYRDKAVANGYAEQGFAMEQKLPIRQTQDNPVYAGLVESLDDAVGFVLDHLKTLGLDKNTIVIFTSDNGGVSSGDAFSTSNLPLRGGKGYQWEAGIREPFLIHVPWKTSKGAISEIPVTGADLYPTILDFAGIPLLPDNHKDGLSLKPIIEGKRTKAFQRNLIWHYPHYGNQGGDPASIIRAGDWKLILFHEDMHTELYNLNKDPVESVDLSHTNHQISQELLANLMSYLESVNAVFPEPDPSYDPEKRKTFELSVREKLLPRLEAERKSMLSENYQPNENWWKSKVTRD